MQKFLRQILPFLIPSHRKPMLSQSGVRFGLEQLDDRITPTLSFNMPGFGLSAQQTLPTDTFPYPIAIADFNDDGKPDIVIAGQQNADISVYLNTTPTGAASPTFATPQTYTVGSFPRGISVGDFNGDGKIDIAVANANSNFVSVLLNTTSVGSTTSSFAAQQTVSVGGHQESIAVGDFNGDGKADIVVTGQNNSSVYVLLNTAATGASTPSFSASQTFSVGSNPGGVAVGDINGDGKLDIAVTNGNDNTVSLLLNSIATGASTASFATQQTFAVGQTPVAIAIGDINADGKPDIITANQGSATISVLLNTTTSNSNTASFSTQQTFSGGIDPNWIALGDFNGDGKLDIATTNYNSAMISVLLNTTPAGSSTSTFATLQQFTVGRLPGIVAVGDFNGDAKLDMAVVNYGSNTISLLTNTSYGTLITGNQPSTVSVGDFNNDGRPDVATLNSGDGTLSVYLNTSPAGTANPTYTLQQTFNVGSGANALAIGDFNGDGKSDIAVLNSTSGRISIFLNTTSARATTATFAAAQSFTVGAGNIAIALGDFNSDGRADIAVINQTAGTVGVLLNTTRYQSSTVSFGTLQLFSVGASPAGLVVGDFNGDARPDIAVTNSTGGTVSVLLNTTTVGGSTATFTTRQTFTVGSGASGITVDDFNGDGRLDIAVANMTAGTVSVLLNTTAFGATSASFAAQQSFTVGTAPTSIFARDFDGDGKADLAVTNSTYGTVSVLLNTTTVKATTPTFAAQQTFTVGNGPSAIAVADLNGDGRSDFITANQTNNSLTIGANISTGVQPTSTAPALVVQLGTTGGVSAYNRTSNSWTQLNTKNANVLATSVNGNVVASFGTNGVYCYQLATQTWIKINNLPAVAVAIDPLGNIYESFAGYGTYRYSLATGSATLLSTGVANILAASSNGSVVANIPNKGIYLYRPAASTPFSLINGFNATSLAIDPNGYVMAVFTGTIGIGQYVPYANGWRGIANGIGATSIAMDGSGNLYASIPGTGLSQFNFSTNAWVNIAPSGKTTTMTTSLAADFFGNVYAMFTGSSGTWQYNQATGWVQIGSSSVSLMSLGT